MSKPRPRTIEVEIYDQKYSIVLKTALPESEVRKVAEEVDDRMREIAAQANTARRKAESGDNIKPTIRMSTAARRVT